MKIGKLDKIPNYELLNYILCNSAYVIKWNKNASNISGHCKHVQNIHHLIVECKTVHDMWMSAGNMLYFQVKQEHSVVCFLYEKETTKLNH